MSEQSGDDLVPASVRLGNVVPPEDPEDWTRPLTWAAAIGILGAPLLAAGWFLFAAPDSDSPLVGTWILAVTLATGAALTGSTQIGALRAGTATLGAGLLAALIVVVVGTSFPGTSSPSHAIWAVVAGLGGTIAASTVAPLLASLGSRIRRFAVAALVGGSVSVLVVALLA